MKVAAFGDLHAHLFSEFAEHNEETVNTRLKEILQVLPTIREYMIEHKMGYLLFAGDLFHKRITVDTRVMNLVRDEFRKFYGWGIEIIMIPGNHDQVDNSDYPQHSLESFKEFEYVTVLDRFTPITLPGGLKIYPAPYSKNAQMVKDFLNEYAEDAKAYDGTTILLGHLGVSGAFVGKSSYAMADAFTVADLHPEAFTFGVFGHFHKWQFLGDTKHFFYTGAPIQHNFNDEGQEKGFWVLDTETKKAELVPIKSPEFITVTDWKKADFEKLKGNYLRIHVLSDEVDDLMQKLPEGLLYRLEIERVVKEEKRVNVDFSMGFPKIITEYAKRFNPDALQLGLEILEEAETA